MAHPANTIMNIFPKLILEDRDISQILDLCGHFARTKGEPAEYQKLVPLMKEAVQQLAQAGFNEGRQYEQKQSR